MRGRLLAAGASLLCGAAAYHDNSTRNTDGLGHSLTVLHKILAEPERYDYLVEPPPLTPGDPVAIALHAGIIKVLPLDTAGQRATFSMYLIVTWADPRLRFNENETGVTEIAYDPDGIRMPINGAKIWRPKIVVLNGLHSKTVDETVRINHRGEVRHTSRFDVTAMCPMDLQLYPFDSQSCAVRFEDFDGLPVEDLRFEPSEPARQAGTPWLHVIEEYQPLDRIGPYELVKWYGVHLPTPRIGVTGENAVIVSHVSLVFEFSRSLGPYFITHFVPLWLVTALSCGGLLIRIDAAPARVTLAITTLLVLISLNQILSRELPRISYITAMDILVLVCIIIVLCNNAWYILVHRLCHMIDLRQQMGELRKQGFRQVAGGLMSQSHRQASHACRSDVEAAASEPYGGDAADADHSCRELSPEEMADLKEKFSALIPDRQRRELNLHKKEKTLDIALVVSLLTDLGASLQDARVLARAADLDANGTLDFEEFCAVVARVQAPDWVPHSILVCGKGLSRSTVTRMDRYYCIFACSVTLLFNVGWFIVVAALR